MKLQPQPGPQTEFHRCPADICFFGGSAGGGKSYALLLETLRHINNPLFNAVIFRRTSKQLNGPGFSIWKEAKGIYPLCGARMREGSQLDATFPSGATVSFSHLQHDSNVHDHQSKQYGLVIFDELVQFTEHQFWYLLSRARSVSGIKPYIRAATNPDPDSFVRKMIDWWIGPDGYPIPERSGVVRWFTRINNVLHWGDTRQQVKGFIRDLGLVVGRDAAAMSFTFIRSTLDDNPALTNKDPDYQVKMANLPEVERRRLLDGNWDIRPSAGKVIQAPWFKKRWSGTPEELPPLNVFTASDFAVTPENEDGDPDYTEHGIFGVDSESTLYVLDWWSGRTTSDEWIDALISKWQRWKPVKAFGEAGVIKNAVEPFLKKRMMETGTYVSIEWLNLPRAERSADKQGFKDRSKRAKYTKSQAFQGRASMGKILFPDRGEWVDRVISQCVGFPSVRYDDAFDVMAMMCAAIDRAYEAMPIKPEGRKKVDKWDKAFKRQDKPEEAWKTV